MQVAWLAKTVSLTFIPSQVTVIMDLPMTPAQAANDDCSRLTTVSIIW